MRALLFFVVALFVFGVLFLMFHSEMRLKKKVKEEFKKLSADIANSTSLEDLKTLEERVFDFSVDAGKLSTDDYRIQHISKLFIEKHIELSKKQVTDEKLQTSV